MNWNAPYFPSLKRVWINPTVPSWVVRFWLFAGICVALGVGIFYADFLGIGSVK